MPFSVANTMKKTIKYLIFTAVFPTLLLPNFTAKNEALAVENTLNTEDVLESPINALTASQTEEHLTLQEESFIAQTLTAPEEKIAVKSVQNLTTLAVEAEKRTVIVTAYSSTPDQTDSTPFTTAMGSTVRDGIVATNFLPFGTKVKFPEIYGDKIFVVEDRMALKNSHKVDIWFPDRQSALEFGVKYTEVVVLK